MKRNMYVLLFCVFSCLFLLSLISCDRDNSKIRDFASRVIVLLNAGDYKTIKGIYPNASDIDSLKSGFNVDSIQIEYDRMTNGYKVLLNKDVWFVVSEESPSVYKIEKSHGLFVYDKKKMYIAQKTRRITPNMSDLKISKALEDTAFFSFLADKSLARLKKLVYPKVFDSQYTTSDPSMFCLQIIVYNENNKKVLGSDYKIKAYTLWMGSEDEIKIINGKDVPENDSISFPIKFMQNGSGGTGVDCKLIFLTDNLSTLEILDRYYEPNINDYNEYLNTSEK